MDTKYRKPVLRGPIGDRVRELIREICRSKDVEIIHGHVSKDHVHIFVWLLLIFQSANSFSRLKANHPVR